MITEPISLPASSNGSAVGRAPDGSVWVGLEGANALVRVDTATQTAGPIKQIPTPNAGMGGIAVAPDGRVWFTEFKTDRLGCFNPAANSFTEYFLPSGSGAGGIVYQPADGNLWVLLTLKSAWGVFNQSFVQVASYPIPSGSTLPHGPCVGTYGNIYFCEIDKSKFGRITPAGVCTEWAVSGKPTVCCVGGDGNIYFTDQNGTVGCVNFATLVVTQWPTPTPGGVPYGIAADAQGNLVFTERTAGNVVTMPAGGGAMTRYAFPALPGVPSSGPNCQPNKLVLGGDGAVWGAERVSQKVFRLG